jgi:membrane protein YqaA with SNARE-associated domain
VKTLKAILLSYGAVGLGGIAFIDSAMVPLAGGPDGVLMVLVAVAPERTALYVLTATLGSLVGSVVLYGLSRKAGQAALTRIAAQQQIRLRRLMDRYDLLAIMVAVLLPPPFPTKLVVIAAGVFRMRLGRFALGTLMGRALRFSLEGYLTLRFGSQAMMLLKRYSLLAVAAVAVFAAVLVWGQRLIARRLAAETVRDE